MGVGLVLAWRWLGARAHRPGPPKHPKHPLETPKHPPTRVHVDLHVQQVPDLGDVQHKDALDDDDVSGGKLGGGLLGRMLGFRVGLGGFLGLGWCVCGEVELCGGAVRWGWAGPHPKDVKPSSNTAPDRETARHPTSFVSEVRLWVAKSYVGISAG